MFSSLKDRFKNIQKYLPKVSAILAALILFSPTYLAAQNLEEAISEAIHTNPQVLLSAENWSKVEKDIHEAFADFLPSVDLRRVQLKHGDMVNWFWVDGVMEEMYDIVILTEVNENMALGFKCAHIRKLLKGDASQSVASYY
ncbi:hypothetical protein ACQZV8_18810 [Magnetococcales bacterium HHB-1]